MPEQTKSDAKVQKPSTHFDEPQQVVVDPMLSKEQKVAALDTLEQDARQLAEAASEGMTGGERNKLHDVLNAKAALALPPVANGYGAILRDLRARQQDDPAIATRVLLDQAIAALVGLVALSGQALAAVSDATPKSAATR
jgi:hypothetical protein